MALVGIVLLIVFGPDREEVKRRFEFYGAEGDLKIMPELSIDDGDDAVHQLPKYFQDTPPPPPLEILDEEPDPAAVEEMPVVKETSEVETDIVGQNVDADPALDPVDQVELTLPQQTSRDWRIVYMVRPNYPLDATETERRTPVITVEVAIFVNPDGRVAASMITSSTGGPAFANVVLKAVEQWLFQWLIGDGRPASGRWIEMTWNFKSPYFTNFNGLE